MSDGCSERLLEQIHRGRGLAELFDALGEAFRGVVPYNRLALGLVDETGGKLSLTACRCDGPDALKVGFADDLAGSTLEELLRTGRTRVLNDLPAYLAGKPSSRSTRLLVREGMRANLSVPLRLDGRPLGVLFFASRRVGEYADDHARLAARLAGHLAIGVERARLIDDLRARNAELEQRCRGPVVHPPAGLVGDGPAMRAVRRAVQQVGPTDSTVLITGETGTGKELVARAVHSASRRRDQPFVAVNCAAVPAGLVASELFGHEAGAFTGATRRRPGRFELAAAGTIFLDEIADTPAETQAMLLRVLQERVVERVGGHEPIGVAARVIAATNADLTRAVAAGAFRSDLFYRLNVFPIRVPPLRERPEDVPGLVRHFLAHRPGRADSGLSERGLRLLQAYHWPGNVRELQHLVERAVIVSDGGPVEIDPAWLSAPAAPAESGTWREREARAITDALARCGGKIYGPDGAAAMLGLRPTTLYGKMRKLGLVRQTSLPRTAGRGLL